MSSLLLICSFSSSGISFRYLPKKFGHSNSVSLGRFLGDERWLLVSAFANEANEVLLLGEGSILGCAWIVNVLGILWLLSLAGSSTSKSERLIRRTGDFSLTGVEKLGITSSWSGASRRGVGLTKRYLSSCAISGVPALCGRLLRIESSAKLNLHACLILSAGDTP